MPLPAASLCYLTDSSFFLPGRCSPTFPASACQAPAPSRSIPLQCRPCAQDTSQALAPRQRELKPCETRLSEPAFCLLEPFVAKILLFTSVQVASDTKSVSPFLQPSKILIVEGEIFFFFQGLINAVALLPLKLISCLRKNRTRKEG